MTGTEMRGRQKRILKDKKEGRETSAADNLFPPLSYTELSGILAGELEGFLTFCGRYANDVRTVGHV